MRDLLDHRAAMGTVYLQPYFLMLLADACLRLGEPSEALAALSDALSHAEANDEHLCTADLHRLRAQAKLSCDAREHEPAEMALQEALAEGRRRSSRIFQLRAARDLARLWAEQGERQKALDLLAPVYGWFTEGFHAQDLRDAKVLLDQLR